MQNANCRGKSGRCDDERFVSKSSKICVLFLLSLFSDFLFRFSDFLFYGFFLVQADPNPEVCPLCSISVKEEE